MNGYLLSTTPNITAQMLQFKFGVSVAEHDQKSQAQSFAQYNGAIESFPYMALNLNAIDCVIIGCGSDNGSLDSLMKSVQEIKTQLPILVLVDGIAPKVVDAFKVEGAEGKYVTQVLDWSLPSEYIAASLIGLSGQFYGAGSSIIPLGDHMRINRLEREIYSVDGDVLNIQNYEFRFLEYLALHLDEVVHVGDVYDFLYGSYKDAPRTDVISVAKSKISKKLDAMNSGLTILRKNQGLPVKQIALSQYGSYDALMAAKNSPIKNPVLKGVPFGYTPNA